MRNNIKALFIDMDGTLIDTDVANTSAYNFAIKKTLGISIDLEANNLTRLTGEVIQDLFPDMGKKLFKEIKTIKSETYKDFLSFTSVNQSVLGCIEANLDKTIVLVSKANYKRVIATLQHHNLLDYFDYFYCNESKMKTKTYNKYLDAILGLELLPQNVMVFENEDSEIANALSAEIPQRNIKQVGV